jgi:hypothetical protein
MVSLEKLEIAENVMNLFAYNEMVIYVVIEIFH